MYNFARNYDNARCQAYKCKQYRDLGSDRHCTLHMYEFFQLNNSSDDFSSKINSVAPKSTDIMCRSLNCKKLDDLVEDYIISSDNDITYIKLCIPHHHELLKKRACDIFLEKTKAKTCDYNNCIKKLGLDKFQNKFFCVEHYNKVCMNYGKTSHRPTCNVTGCNKTARLIKSNDKLWCKKHFELQPNPEIFKSTEQKKYEWIENQKDDDKNILDIAVTNDLDKNILDIAVTTNESDIKWSGIVKKLTNVSNTKNKVFTVYDLLNKCNDISKLKICNSNNKEYCHASSCKIYKQLSEKHQGKWCNSHVNEITKLRNIINKHEGSKEELEARIKEFQLRKFPDINHWKWIMKLLKHYQKHS